MQKYTTFSANSKSGRLFSAGDPIRGAFALFDGDRQQKPRSGDVPRVEAHVAAQRAGDQPAHGQSQPEALAVGVDFDEAVEDVFLLSFGDARAGILNGEGDAPAVLCHGVGERYRSVLSGEPHGVAQQFGERFGEQHARGSGREFLAFRKEPDRGLRHAVFRKPADALPAAGVDVGLRTDGRGVRRFEVGDVEHVVHEFLQEPAVLAYDVDVGIALGVVFRGRRGQFGESDDRVQRGVDFVGDVADEDALHAAGLLGGVFGMGQAAVEARQDEDEYRSQQQDDTQTDLEHAGAA